MATEQAIGRPMEILLVEDSLVDARLTIHALNKGDFKHRVTLIRDGAEAVEFLQREGKFARAPQPDLVLLDLRLPGKDGLDVLADIRADYSLNATAVVILSSSDDDYDHEKCQALGVDSFIQKPVNLDKFLQVISDLKTFWHADMILPAVD